MTLSLPAHVPILPPLGPPNPDCCSRIPVIAGTGSSDVGG